MLLTIHSRTLARAIPSAGALPMYQSPAVFVSASHHAGKNCSRGATSRPTTRSIQTNQAASVLQDSRLCPLSFIRGQSSSRLYSSLYNGLSLLSSRQDPNTQKSHIRSNFSYAGPRKLSDILKTELLDDKSSAEISDLWMTYHEGKEKVHGLTLDEAKGKSVLSRAAQCPFFLHPVFREEGHFMIISQFQAPNYFLLALLEDYRMDPARAQPLLTVSIFDDYAEEKGLTLVRCDIINRGIEDDEGYKICQSLLDDYGNENEFRTVHMFNKKPDAFDVDEFVKEKEMRWKS